MKSDKIYQILYCSRNNIRGTDEAVQTQVEAILSASRRNNAKVNVTGALFFNSVFFAQVLEGSFTAVQQVFERLQLDARHSDLVILQGGYREQRDFEGWSMAYAGSDHRAVLPLADAAEKGASESGNQVLAFLREVVVKQEGWALPERSSYQRAPADDAAFAV